VLDKTGTVTTGRMSVADVVLADGVDRADALRWVGALEQASEHPIAQAIALAAAAEVDVPVPEHFVNHEGLGVEGIVNEHELVVGRPALLADRAMDMPPELDAARHAAEAKGQTVSAAGWDGEAKAVFVVADTVKPSSAEAIASLKALGLRSVLLTGDNATTAKAVAAEVAIEEVIAEVLPSDKLDVVKRLQAEGRIVAMVGDGINDAPALASADVGIVMGAAGSDAAIESADIALMADELLKVPYALRLSRATMRNIKANLVISLALKAGFVLAAVGGVATLWMAVLADTGASIIVIANALRLLRAD
jgi:P-type Cu+ transporter